MKSRILAVLFAVVLTAGTLAGCGSSKKADDTKAETTDEKSEDKASSDEDTKDVNVASEEEAEEAGFSDGTDTDGATVENTVLDTSQELTGIHHADISIRDYGDIKVELDADTAPITVTNFVKLAQEGFYDGLTFWRIIDGFMMQGGDPKGNGTGGSGETIKGEFSSNGVKNDISHVRGIISMARSTDPDSASSQFFIVQSDSTFLDGILQTKVREYRKSSGIYLDGAGLKCPDHNTIRTRNRSDLLYDPGRFIQNSMGDLRNDTGNDPGPWNSGSDLRNGFSQIFLQKSAAYDLWRCCGNLCADHENGSSGI